MNSSLEVELSSGGSNLYIFFGGIASGISIPPFEFYNASKIIDENKIFIRDFSQCWYQNGLIGISSNISSTAQHLNNYIEKTRPKKLFFVGNSMGGYAAILFANLVGCGEIIAFSPQTFISPLLRFKYKDSRWARQVFKTYRTTLFKKKILDLKPLILNRKKNLKTSIYVSTQDKLDHIHALHLSGLSGVSIFEFKDGGHDVVKILRDRDLLPEIMLGNYE